MLSELLRGQTLKAVTQPHHDNTAQELGKNKSIYLMTFEGRLTHLSHILGGSWRQWAYITTTNITGLTGSGISRFGTNAPAILIWLISYQERKDV